MTPLPTPYDIFPPHSIPWAPGSKAFIGTVLGLIMLFFALRAALTRSSTPPYQSATDRIKALLTSLSGKREASPAEALELAASLRRYLELRIGLSLRGGHTIPVDQVRPTLRGPLTRLQSELNAIDRERYRPGHERIELGETIYVLIKLLDEIEAALSPAPQERR